MSLLYSLAYWCTLSHYIMFRHNTILKSDTWYTFYNDIMVTTSMLWPLRCYKIYTHNQTLQLSIVGDSQSLYYKVVIDWILKYYIPSSIDRIRATFKILDSQEMHFLEKVKSSEKRKRINAGKSKQFVWTAAILQHLREAHILCLM